MSRRYPGRVVSARVDLRFSGVTLTVFWLPGQAWACDLCDGPCEHLHHAMTTITPQQKSNPTTQTGPTMNPMTAEASDAFAAYATLISTTVDAALAYTQGDRPAAAQLMQDVPDEARGEALLALNAHLIEMVARLLKTTPEKAVEVVRLGILDADTEFLIEASRPSDHTDHQEDQR